MTSSWIIVWGTWRYFHLLERELDDRRDKPIWLSSLGNFDEFVYALRNFCSIRCVTSFLSGVYSGSLGNPQTNTYGRQAVQMLAAQLRKEFRADDKFENTHEASWKSTGTQTCHRGRFTRAKERISRWRQVCARCLLTDCRVTADLVPTARCRMSAL